MLLKFRTMTAHRDFSDNLLPDKYRMTRLGNFLRSTSIDEFLSALILLSFLKAFAVCYEAW